MISLTAILEYFKKEAYEDQANFDENLCRSLACEVLARYIVRRVDAEKLAKVMSKRYSFIEADGDESSPTSILELAIDLHCTFFLSADESTKIVTDLWNGSLIQINLPNNQIEYIPYVNKHISHFNPNRISVPKYQNYFRVFIWLAFLTIYSITVQSPTYQIDPKKSFDFFEIILYTMSISFLFEEVNKCYKIFKSQSFYTLINFWFIVNILSYTLLTIAFILRMAGIFSSSNETSGKLHILAFEFLSCVAPLIWIKLLPAFESFSVWIGTMELVVFKMLKESFIFFLLLILFTIGFIQSLWALDAADGNQELNSITNVASTLLRSLFGDADFDTLSSNHRYGQPFGIIIFYGRVYLPNLQRLITDMKIFTAWNVITILILMNVLVALYASEYEGITDDAVAEYLALFAGKTISMIRTPDQFVYIAPFNLIEMLFIAPLEYVLSRRTYKTMNKIILSVLFFIPLSIIAFIESQGDLTTSKLWKSLIDTRVPIEIDENVQDPEIDEEGLQISTVPYQNLRSRLPDHSKTLEKCVNKNFDDLYENLKKFQSLAQGIQIDIRNVEKRIDEENNSRKEESEKYLGLLKEKDEKLEEEKKLRLIKEKEFEAKEKERLEREAKEKSEAESVSVKSSKGKIKKSKK